MDLKKWFDVNIRDKALILLAELGAQFKDNDGKPDWRKVVTNFSDFCDGTLQPPARDIVNRAIDLLKLSDDVEKLKSFWNKTPQQVRDILTTQLESGGPAISWDILGQTGTGFKYGSINGPWKSVLNLSANAQLSLALQSLGLTDPAATALGISGETDQRFLKIGMAGQLALGAGGNLPLGFVSFGAQASTQGNASPDYYCADCGKWLFIEAHINNIPHLASPFDAADIAASYSHNLKAIQLNVAGSLDTSLNTKASKTYGTSFTVKSDSLDVDTQIDIGATASLGYTANFNLDGSWNLAVKPLADGYLNVILKKNDSQVAKTDFSLSASIGISGLDVVGDAIVKKYMPDAAPLLTKLQPYLNFGDMLKQEVETNLDKFLNVTAGGSGTDSIKSQLVAALLGDAQADALAATIGDAAKAALNNELNVLSTKADSAGTKIMTSLVDDLKLPEALQQKLLDLATGKMGGFIASIQTKLSTALSKIVTDNQGKLTPLFKPLEDVGTVVADLQGDVNKIAQQLLGPVITFLTRYQDFRNKVTTAIENSAKLKLALYIGRTDSTTTSADTLLEFKINTAVAKASEYYKQMLGGNFSNALAAARAGSDGISILSGKFNAAAATQIETDISLNIFGAAFTSKTIMNSDVKVEVDVNGKVSLATSKSEYDKVFSALGETRSISFINSFQLPGAVNKGIFKILNTGLTMSYKDTRLKESELKAYLGSLENANLVSTASLQSAVERYNQLADQTAKEKKKMGAEIGINMAFTSQDIQSLLAETPAAIVNRAINKQLICYFYNNQKKYRQFTTVMFAWDTRTHDLFAQIRGIATSGQLGDALIKYDRPGIHAIRDMKTVPISDRHYINMAWHIGTNAVNLLKIIQNIRAASQITLSEATLKDDVKTLNKYNNDNNKYLKDWLKVKGVLASLGITDESVPAPTLAFMAAIGEICQMGDRGTDFLVPSVKWSVLGWQVEQF